MIVQNLLPNLYLYTFRLIRYGYLDMNGNFAISQIVVIFVFKYLVLFINVIFIN